LIGLCIGRPKCVVANSKSTRSMLISACNSIKRLCFRCENLVHDSPLPCNQPVPLLNTKFFTVWPRFSVTSFCLQLDAFKTQLEWPLSHPRPACHFSTHVAAELFAQGSSNRCFGSADAFKHSHQRQNDVTGFWYVSRLQETVTEGRFVCASGNSRGNLNIAHQTLCSVCCVTIS